MDASDSSAPARLRHDLTGPAAAPVIALGPSLGTTLEMWDIQALTLSARWRVLRFDVRGHGRSEVLPGPYSIGELAGDVLGLLDELGFDRVAYCGLSLGGAIGQWLAVHHPDRIGSLVLCSSAARFGEPTRWRERAAHVRAGGIEWLSWPTAERWFTADFRRREPGEADRLLRMLRGTPVEGYAACCDALAEFDLRDQLAAITVPTRMIVGDCDPATPVAMSQELAAGIADADLVVVPAGAHLVNIERPAAVTGAIIEHLDHTYP